MPEDDACHQRRRPSSNRALGSQRARPSTAPTFDIDPPACLSLNHVTGSEVHKNRTRSCGFHAPERPLSFLECFCITSRCQSADAKENNHAHVGSLAVMLVVAHTERLRSAWLPPRLRSASLRSRLRLFRSRCARFSPVLNLKILRDMIQIAGGAFVQDGVPAGHQRLPWQLHVARMRSAQVSHLLRHACALLQLHGAQASKNTRLARMG